MNKGGDISAKFEGIYLVHHNCPGLEKYSLSFSQHLLFIPLQGEIKISLKEAAFSLGTGRMLYLPPEHTHSFASSDHQGERLIALIDDKFWKTKVGAAFGPTTMPISQLVREIFFYLLLHPKTKHQTSLTSVLVEALSEHLELTSTNGNVSSIEHLESQVKDFRVMAALEFMKSHLQESVSMNVVAKKSGLSLRSLNRLVLAETGYSPRHLLIRYRVAKAQELLLDGKGNVTDVAMRVGYNSLSQFIAVFRGLTGQLPSEFSIRNS